MTSWILTLALAAVANPGVTIADAQGGMRQPLQARKGGLAVLLFVTHDCPISNHYAQEIRRICEAYEGRGVSCTLVYVDPSLTDAAALAHAREYGHGRYPVVVDREHLLVRETGVTTTPEAAVLDDAGRIGYRGRIDDFFAAWGKARREAREHDLRDALDAMLTGRPVAKPETRAVGCFIVDLARGAGEK